MSSNNPQEELWVVESIHNNNLEEGSQLINSDKARAIRPDLTSIKNNMEPPTRVKIIILTIEWAYDEKEYYILFSPWD